MKARIAISLVTALLVFGLVATGCGGGGSNGNSAETNATSAPGGETPAAPGEAEAAVPSEAESAATGDIPDNQTFLLFHDPKAGYSIRYPEGWARKGSGVDVTFQEKANTIHILVAGGEPQTPAAAAVGIARLKRKDPTVKGGQPQQVTINGQPVIKVTYTRQSASDPVTGKRLPLTIDRYEYASGGKVAVLDLATPVGVDNVDAYRMISESFKWQP